MKKMMVVIVVLAIASSGQGAYTYTYGPGTYFGDQDLANYQSVLVSGGSGHRLTLDDHSTARIESTTHLTYSGSTPVGGIAQIDIGDYSTTVVAGGEIAEVSMVSYARLSVSGGRIDYLGAQLAGSIPAAPADKYIQFICDSYSYNSATKRLTGVWADDSLFNIQLVDTSPWPSGFTFDSINFTIVPEPLTFGLLAIGASLARRLRRA